MKKLLIIAMIALGLTSCFCPDYSTESSPNGMVSQFIDFEKIAQDGLNGETKTILRDRHTDVLYFVFVNGYKGGITPIVKPDGTFLTYREWKERN